MVKIMLSKLHSNHERFRLKGGHKEKKKKTGVSLK